MKDSILIELFVCSDEKITFSCPEALKIRYHHNLRDIVFTPSSDDTLIRQEYENVKSGAKCTLNKIKVVDALDYIVQQDIIVDSLSLLVFIVLEFTSP